MRLITLFLLAAVAVTFCSGQNTQFYGFYNISPADTSGCEQLSSYCCLGGTIEISGGSVFNRLTLNGSYSQNSYPNCYANSRPYEWTIAVSDASKNQFQVVAGMDSRLGTVYVTFATDQQTYDASIFFSTGYGYFHATPASLGGQLQSTTTGSSKSTSDAPRSVPVPSHSAAVRVIMLFLTAVVCLLAF